MYCRNYWNWEISKGFLSVSSDEIHKSFWEKIPERTPKAIQRKVLKAVYRSFFMQKFEEFLEKSIGFFERSCGGVSEDIYLEEVQKKFIIQ